MELLGNQIQQKSAFKYYCIFCDYGSNKKCNYETHISCLKHYKNCKMETNGNQIQQIQPKISQTNQSTCQSCNKQFKHRSGLWKHHKKCANVEHMYQGINLKDKDALVLHLLQQNVELQNKIIALSSQTSITNNHNINNY